MTHHTQLEDNIGGANNLRAWKYNISLVIQENELDQFITKEVPEPEGDEAKDSHKRSMAKVAHKRSMAKAKRIIEYSTKDHLIPRVPALNTPKEVYDALKNLFEGNNINRR